MCVGMEAGFDSVVSRIDKLAVKYLGGSRPAPGMVQLGYVFANCQVQEYNSLSANVKSKAVARFPGWYLLRDVSLALELAAGQNGIFPPIRTCDFVQKSTSLGLSRIIYAIPVIT